MASLPIKETVKINNNKNIRIRQRYGRKNIQVRMEALYEIIYHIPYHPAYNPMGLFAIPD